MCVFFFILTKMYTYCQLATNCFVAFVLLINAAAANKPSDPAVLVISFDGFRNEYLHRNLTPYINQLRLKHTYSDYMYNVFPTKTFTNHHSIATGLYPSKHGVMNNQVYDLRLKRALPYSYELFHYNEDIWPIYVSIYISTFPLIQNFYLYKTYVQGMFTCKLQYIHDLAIKINKALSALE